jgi:hypothetical protein
MVEIKLIFKTDVSLLPSFGETTPKGSERFRKDSTRRWTDKDSADDSEEKRYQLLGRSLTGETLDFDQRVGILICEWVYRVGSSPLGLSRYI